MVKKKRRRLPVIEQRPKSAPLSGEMIMRGMEGNNSNCGSSADGGGSNATGPVASKAPSDLALVKKDEVLAVCDLSSKQHAAMKTVIKVCQERGDGNAAKQQVRQIFGDLDS